MMFGQYFTQTPLDQAEYVFVVLENKPDWSLDEAMVQVIKASGKPIIVWDYWEEAWNKLTAQKQPFMEVFGRQVKTYFQRECRSAEIHPIDWYNHIPVPQPDTFEQYCARPIDVLMCYGYSHPMRPRLHATILAATQDYGWTFITNPSHMEHEKPPFAVLLHQPWYDRISQDELLDLQGKAKITISFPGAGEKCFRHSEACINSVMAMPLDHIRWQANWWVGNSLKMPMLPNEWPFQLRKALDNPENLYQIYLNGTKRAAEIKPEVVWNSYILPIITK